MATCGSPPVRDPPDTRPAQKSPALAVLKLRESGMLRTRTVASHSAVHRECVSPLRMRGWLSTVRGRLGKLLEHPQCLAARADRLRVTTQCHRALVNQSAELPIIT